MIYAPPIPNIIAPGKWRLPRDGGLVRGMTFTRRCCCSAIPPTPECSALGNPFIPPAGCAACLCKNSSSFALCVDGETGDAAALNTAPDTISLTGAGGVYTYEEAGVRRYVLTLTTDGALDYERMKIESYIWNSGTLSWDAVRDNAAALVDMTGVLCNGTFSEDGATYTWQARRDWTEATTLSVAFAGITYMDGAGCGSRQHLSGALGTYAQQVPTATGTYPSEVNGECAWPDAHNDTDVDASLESNGATAYITVSGTGAVTSGKRGYTVFAFAASAGFAIIAPYFYGEYELDEEECKGEKVINNQITGACDTFAGNVSLGYGGTCTIELS